MASETGTRDKILSCVDDIELIAKEMIENSIAPKLQRLSMESQDQLTGLLVQKDKEFKERLKRAEVQAEVQKKIENVKGEIDKFDQEIKQLQKHLKEAEHIMATAIFQAKKKLESINRAKKRPILSEELIKYAHRISASNAVAAPNTWEQGDPRRPYPTDIEMRLGFLGRLSDLPMNGNLQQQSSLSEGITNRGPGNHPGDHPHPSNNQSSPRGPGNQLSWQPSSDMGVSSSMPPSASASSNHTSVHNKENVEDVEVMSTDSSSSSSSDSQ
ncbi:Mediator of RNA polymerase II transcription subunit 4 [Nymphon striatum]|nr:Mediator of RNA polymerase II transcription subunit 4 [Nymphon striatum]